jgi:hypothetical protein
MGNDFKKQILSILVNWYEASPAYVRKLKPIRRRMMHLHGNYKTDFVPYNIENSSVRKDVNQAVLELAGMNLIGYEWMKGERDHIISRLWLTYEVIEQIYKYLDRQPKGDIVDAVLSQLLKLRDEVNKEWAHCWLKDTYNIISRKRSIGSSLPENACERNDLLQSVVWLSKKTEIETLERIFSFQCFGDSKRFERSVKTRLVRILKKYLVNDDECTEDEALRMAGIVRHPEKFEFSGSLSIFLPNGKIDFAPLRFGGTLTIEDVQQGVITLESGIRRIISIENKANYVEYVRKNQSNDEFIIYHGGQFSPAKRVFLKAIVSAMPLTCEFYHWGDIDYGGFCMLARLRREILPGIQAWKMGKEELQQYLQYTSKFSDTYRKRVSSLLEEPELDDLYMCIEFMLESGVRLEQEAMLL